MLFKACAHAAELLEEVPQIHHVSDVLSEMKLSGVVRMFLGSQRQISSRGHPSFL